MMSIMYSAWKKISAIFNDTRNAVESRNATNNTGSTDESRQPEVRTELLQISANDNRRITSFCNMTIVLCVHQARQVTGVCSAIVQRGMKTLRPTPDSLEFLKLPLNLSSADNIQLILNKDLAGSLQLKLIDLTQLRWVPVLKLGIKNDRLQISGNDCRQVTSVWNMATSPYLHRVPTLTGACSGTAVWREIEKLRPTPNDPDSPDLSTVSSSAGRTHVKSKNDKNVFDKSVMSQRSEIPEFSILDTLREIFYERMNSGESIIIKTSINTCKVISLITCPEKSDEKPAPVTIPNNAKENGDADAKSQTRNCRSCLKYLPQTSSNGRRSM